DSSFSSLLASHSPAELSHFTSSSFLSASLFPTFCYCLLTEEDIHSYWSDFIHPLLPSFLSSLPPSSSPCSLSQNSSRHVGLEANILNEDKNRGFRMDKEYRKIDSKEKER